MLQRRVCVRHSTIVVALADGHLASVLQSGQATVRATPARHYEARLGAAPISRQRWLATT